MSAVETEIWGSTETQVSPPSHAAAHSPASRLSLHTLEYRESEFAALFKSKSETLHRGCWALASSPLPVGTPLFIDDTDGTSELTPDVVLWPGDSSRRNKPELPH